MLRCLCGLLDVCMFVGLCVACELYVILFMLIWRFYVLIITLDAYRCLRGFLFGFSLWF